MRAVAFLAIAALLGSTLAACGESVCNASTCSRGCCEAGLCYQGTGVTGGKACGGGGGGGSGGGGGGGSCSLGSCSSEACCAQDSLGNALECRSSYCEKACSGYDDPCNASLKCCNTGTAMHGYVCKAERCDLCLNRNSDCSSSFDRSRCCPGLTCLLKTGFSTVYECQ
jgi:hypothetical protein